MAYDIIKQGGKKGPSVALIDLDFESGACADYLDLKAGLSPDDLQGDPARIDVPLTAAFIRRHKTGIHVLAAENRLGGNDAVEFGGHGITRLLAQQIILRLSQS